jgi:hypothetical protein
MSDSFQPDLTRSGEITEARLRLRMARDDASRGEGAVALADRRLKRRLK